MKNLINKAGKVRRINKKWIVIFGLLIFVLLVISRISSIFRNQQNQINTVQGSETKAESLLGKTEVNAEYDFGALNENGESAGLVKFRVTSAEKTNQVLIQGKPANAKGDKTFLVLNIEIDNNETEKRYISPVDILRLVGEEDKKFAPDVHSNIVEVQPISTKITRAGFVVLADQNEFLLQIGELEGAKQFVEIKFDM